MHFLSPFSLNLPLYEHKKRPSYQRKAFTTTSLRLAYKNILTHTSNAKCFRNVTLINMRGLAKNIVPVRGYGRHSPNQAMIKRE